MVGPFCAVDVQCRRADPDRLNRAAVLSVRHYECQDDVDEQSGEARGKKAEYDICDTNEGRIDVEIFSDATANAGNHLVV